VVLFCAQELRNSEAHNRGLFGRRLTHSRYRAALTTESMSSVPVNNIMSDLSSSSSPSLTTFWITRPLPLPARSTLYFDAQASCTTPSSSSRSPARSILYFDAQASCTTPSSSSRSELSSDVLKSLWSASENYATACQSPNCQSLEPYDSRLCLH
jgi:hypothetical protein